jgi:hypothetical protein
MEDVIQEEGMKDFKRTSRVGVTTFLAQGCSNKHMRYLVVAEYDGVVRRALLLCWKEEVERGVVPSPSSYAWFCILSMQY